MRTLQKRVLAMAAVIALGLGSAAAVAQRGDCMGYGPGAGPGGGMRGDPGQRAELKQQRWAERMELLESRLKLTAEQQPAWQTFKAALEAQHQTRGMGWKRQQDRAGSAVEHFDDRVSFMETHLAQMKTTAKAADDLYQQLSPEQQKVMDDFFANWPRGPMGPGGGGKRAS